MPRMRGNRLLAGDAIGVASIFTGVALPVLLDLPTGAVIAWSMALVALFDGFLISVRRMSH